MKKLLDRYTGKMLDPTMRFKSVEPKPGSRHNPLHEELVDRPCIIDLLDVGSDAIILFEPASDPGVLHHLYTTSVRKIENEDGMVRFWTRNTVYTLCKIGES